MNSRIRNVGLWDRIFESFESYDKYEISAHEAVELARKHVRSKYGDNRDITRPKEAEELKFYIRGMSEQGGLENYKHALARWQIFKALYPEWITDADRPEFISQVWKNL